VWGRARALPLAPPSRRRCDAKGGLDNYLLKTPDSLLHSDLAVSLKRRIIDKLHADGKLNTVLGLQSQYLPEGFVYRPELPKAIPLEELQAASRGRAGSSEAPSQ